MNLKQNEFVLEFMLINKKKSLFMVQCQVVLVEPKTNDK